MRSRWAPDRRPSYAQDKPQNGSSVLAIDDLAVRVGFGASPCLEKPQVVDSRKRQKRQNCHFRRSEVHGGYTHCKEALRPGERPLSGSASQRPPQAGFPALPLSGWRVGPVPRRLESQNCHQARVLPAARSLWMRCTDISHVGLNAMPTLQSVKGA